MVDKDANEKIKKITKLLEKGGTMLATHHECGAPMFRYQGKVVCPVCDFPDNDQAVDQSRNLEPKNIEEKAAKSAPIQEEIHNIIMKKITEQARSLEKETELTRIIDKMECIEQGLTILRLLKEK